MTFAKKSIEILKMWNYNREKCKSKGDGDMRKTELFDDGWLFHQGDIERAEPKWKGPVYISAKTERMKWGPASVHYNDRPEDFRTNVEFSGEKWQWVELPHDYVITGEMSGENNNALGFFTYENAWYRKHFFVPEEDEGSRITLLFEGVATRCTVYLNGCELKHNFCGYISFEVDLTDYLYYGEEENVLAVYVRYDHNEGWWYQGGGIYRHVWLVKTASVSVDLWGVCIRPEPLGEKGAWRIAFETTLRNDGYCSQPVRVVSTVLDREDKLCVRAEAESFVPLRQKSVVKYETQIENPHLWDTEDPYIYRVQTRLYIGSEEIDAVCDRFGFRTFCFTADNGFLLNGRRVDICGVCGHGDFGLTGKAVPDNIFRYKVQLMKQMGANGYRTSHYPQAAAMMDALDEAGFIVMDETRWFDSTEEGLAALEMMIRRDRNRPGVFMWSIGNEEPHHLTQIGRRINKAMIARAKQLDPTRPTTSAVSNSPDKATVFDDLELIGINYNHPLWDTVRQKYPQTPIFSSECCAAGTTRGWYEEDSAAHGYISAYDHDMNAWFIGREHFWKLLKARPWMFGSFQWIAFEHRGEAVWPRICSQAGAIDLFLQKKDAFYQNQSLFSKKPMIHLLPHWNWEDRPGEKITVVAYTNCEECELFLNGVSLGKKEIEMYSHAQWEVEYCPGRLEAVAYCGGCEAARDIRETTGRPVKLVLHLDNDVPNANGQDIAMISCWCEDEQGREVPDACPLVRFDCNPIGTLVGTGSDISDPIPVNCPERRMRAGRISVAVRAGGKPGILRIQAQSENLAGAVLSISIK